MNKAQLKKLIKEELEKALSERIRSGSPEFMNLQVALRKFRYDQENSSVQMLARIAAALIQGRDAPTPSEQVTNPEFAKSGKYVLDLAEKRIGELRRLLSESGPEQP